MLSDDMPRQCTTNVPRAFEGSKRDAQNPVKGGVVQHSATTIVPTALALVLDFVPISKCRVSEATLDCRKLARASLALAMKKKRSVKDVHKQSLGEQLDDPETHGVRTKPHKKSRRAAKELDDDATIGAEQSAAILDLARQQQDDEAQLRVQETAGADTRAKPCAAAHRTCSSAQHRRPHHTTAPQ